MKYDLTIFRIDPMDGKGFIEVVVSTKDLTRLRLFVESGTDAIKDDLLIQENNHGTNG